MNRSAFRILGVVAVLGVSAGAASAIECGGIVPCSCGDRVASSRKLKSSVDPVVSSNSSDVCVGTALTVASGVTLDLGGNKIRGDGSGTGIGIDGGATSVAVTNGSLQHFALGIVGAATGSSISRMNVSDVSGNTIALSGDSNVLLKNVVKRGASGSTCSIATVGNGNLVEKNVASDSGPVCIFGDSGTADRNDIRRSTNAGFALFGDSGLATGNFVARSAGAGIVIKGGSNLCEGNTSRRNALDGIKVESGGGNIVDGNATDHNSSFGIDVVTSGNSVSDNMADQNGAGISSTAGACTFTGNSATNNTGDGLVAVDGGAGADTDGGGNVGTGNGGAVQCSIDGASCL